MSDLIAAIAHRRSNCFIVIKFVTAAIFFRDRNLLRESSVALLKRQKSVPLTTTISREEMRRLLTHHPLPLSNPKKSEETSSWILIELGRTDNNAIPSRLQHNINWDTLSLRDVESRKPNQATSPDGQVLFALELIPSIPTLETYPALNQKGPKT